MYLYEPLGGFGSFIILVVAFWIMLKITKPQRDAKRAKKRLKRLFKYKYNNCISLDGNDPDLKEQIKTLKSIYDKVEITIDANIPDLEKRVKFLKSIHDNVKINYSKD